MLEILFNNMMTKPAPRRDGPIYWKLCFINPMGSPFVVVVLALVGLVVSASDLVHKLLSAATPSQAAADGTLCTAEIKWRPSPVSRETQRQIQLMSALMNFENSFMLLSGTLLDSTALMVPWLAVQTVTVMLELLILCSQIVSVGLHMNRLELLTTATTIHNFLQVLCFLCKKRIVC